MKKSSINQWLHYKALRQTPIDAVLTHLQSVSGSLDDSQANTAIQELIDAIQFAIAQNESPLHLAQRIRKDRRTLPPLRPTLSSHEAPNVVKAIQNTRAIARKKNTFRGQRKLDFFREDIRQLHAAGASERDIVAWLQHEHQLSVSQSTVHKYLKELKQDGHQAT